MTELRYRSFVGVEDLEVGECTMHRCANGSGPEYWHLWCRVLREDNGQPLDFCVPVNVGGAFIESGPGGKTWGLTRAGMDRWQFSPSINVLGDHELHPGAHDAPSMWHQTPAVVGVPPSESWITEAA